MIKTVAIVQARAGSQRLPGKVLMDIAGRTMLDRVVERVRLCDKIDQVVVATTTKPGDDAVAQHCVDKNIDFVRGSEDDVLSRYVFAAERFSADNVVRITSDCPLIDPDIVDSVVEALAISGCDEGSGHDYACNFFPHRLYPRGLDAEALTVETLRRLDQQADQKRYREHVTLMVYENPSQFKIASVSNRLDHSHLRWTVDTAEDLQLVRTLYQHFIESGQTRFGYTDVMKALSMNWHWCNINRSVNQKAA